MSIISKSNTMLDFSCSSVMKFLAKSSLLLILLLFSTLHLVCSQASVHDCTLDIQFSSALNRSNCKFHNWGGFINNCCGLNFGNYLCALGLKSNQTGKIFLNSTEQKNCLASIEAFGKNFTGCGIEKLTSGAGSCSDYTVTDVIKKLGDKLKRLDEDCMPLSIIGRDNETCTTCLKAWEDIKAKSDITMGSESANISAYLCRFAVLTSIGIYDRESIKAFYKCLGGHNLSSDQLEIKARGNANVNQGLWILAFGLTGITVIVLLAALALFVRRIRSAPTIHNEFEDSTSLKITLKDVYVATNNLSASNFIGQGIAGKVYKGIISNGQYVAVKHIIKGGYMETFVREVRSLSHVKHPNLVALLGYCENEAECFLVYELCHNGNLSEWLFGNDKVLSWIQRLKIAVDSARGLEFLHTYPGGCIVHRGTKSFIEVDPVWNINSGETSLCVPPDAMDGGDLDGNGGRRTEIKTKCLGENVNDCDLSKSKQLGKTKLKQGREVSERARFATRPMKSKQSLESDYGFWVAAKSFVVVTEKEGLSGGGGTATTSGGFGGGISVLSSEIGSAAGLFVICNFLASLAIDGMKKRGDESQGIGVSAGSAISSRRFCSHIALQLSGIVVASGSFFPIKCRHSRYPYSASQTMLDVHLRRPVCLDTVSRMFQLRRRD